MKLAYKFYYRKKFPELDTLCIVSNDLYNQANYIVKEEFKKSGKWLRYNDLDKVLKTTENLNHEINYRKLKAQVAQQVLRILDKNWTSFFNSLKAYKKNPKDFKGLPKSPGFRKTKDRNLLVYTNQSCQIKDNNRITLEENIELSIPKTDIDFSKFQQIRVLPRKRRYEIEIVYNKDCVNFELDQENYLTTDLGVDNFAACVSKEGSFLLDGKSIKSVNQYFNKMKAKNQAYRDKKGKNVCHKKSYELSNYRGMFTRDQFHKMTRFLINYCILKNIGTIVCGYNKQWKDSIDIGKINNQKFVCMPHKLFLKILKYKCELVGIVLICKEESYTSKCDSLALEPVKKQKKYLGKRVKRGLFQSSMGKLINADVNGALNTLRKVIGDCPFIKGIIDSVVLFNPVKIRFADLSCEQTLSNFLVRC